MLKFTAHYPLLLMCVLCWKHLVESTSVAEHKSDLTEYDVVASQSHSLSQTKAEHFTSKLNGRGHRFQVRRTDDAQRHRKSAKQTSQLASKPCNCIANDPTWVRPNRTSTQCVFIDLGAGNGDTVRDFVAGGFGKVEDCGGGTGYWEAILVEGNPRFTLDLERLAAEYPGQVHIYPGTAAHTCETQAKFYLDSDTTRNHWGSSLDVDVHQLQDWAKPLGLVEQPDTREVVTVTTVNINRLIAENTRAGDWTMLKMDVEGAEWDLIPCLALSPSASLINRLYLDKHPSSWQVGKTTPTKFDAAEQDLRRKNVDMPVYFKPA